jgi:hypothetical protein
LYHICDLIHERTNDLSKTSKEFESDRLSKIAQLVTFFLNNKENYEANYLWILQLYVLIQNSLPSLQYLLYLNLKKISDERLTNQNAQQFTPIKMFNFLNKNYYTQKNKFTRKTIVHWMTNQSMEIINFSSLNISDSELEKLNSFPNLSISERSEILKTFLKTHYLSQ